MVLAGWGALKRIAEYPERDDYQLASGGATIAARVSVWT